MNEEPDILDAAAVLQQRFSGTGAGFGVVLRSWERAVGPQLAAVSRPSSLRDGTLRVRCEDAMWVSELLHQTRPIVARLTQLPGCQSIEKLKPYVGRVTATPPPTVDPPRPAAVQRQLGDDEKASIERLADTIPHGPEHDAILRAMQAVKRTR